MEIPIHIQREKMVKKLKVTMNMIYYCMNNVVHATFNFWVHLLWVTLGIMTGCNNMTFATCYRDHFDSHMELDHPEPWRMVGYLDFLAVKWRYSSSSSIKSWSKIFPWSTYSAFLHLWKPWGSTRTLLQYSNRTEIAQQRSLFSSQRLISSKKWPGSTCAPKINWGRGVAL